MDIFSTTKVASVLGGATTSDTANTIASVVSAQGKKRLQDQLTQLSDSYAAQFRDISDQLDKLNQVQANIGSAITSLQGAKGSVDALTQLFDGMAETVKDAADPNAVQAMAAAFQAKMSTLRSMTSSASDGNMLSGPDQRVTYTYDASGHEMTVPGRAMGSYYTIAASDGNVWTPNDSGSALVAYKTYPDTPAGKSSGFYGGTKLNSLNGNSINFTVGVNGATPQTLTGTYTNKGVGVADSWFYDDLSTPAGRARAATDVEAAQGAAKAESQRYDAAINVAQYYSAKVDLQVSTLTNQQSGLTDEQALKAADLQDKFKQAQAALQLAFQGQALSGLSLVGAMPSGNNIFTPDTSTSNFVDIFA